MYGMLSWQSRLNLDVNNEDTETGVCSGNECTYKLQQGYIASFMDLT